jgi:hypothetical protein
MQYASVDFMTHLAKKENRLLQLVLQNTGLDELKGPSVHLDEAIAHLAIGNSCGAFLKIDTIHLLI